MFEPTILPNFTFGLFSVVRALIINVVAIYSANNIRDSLVCKRIFSGSYNTAGETCV